MGRIAFPKLYVYDQSSSLDRKQAAGRFSGSSNVVTLPVNNVNELKAGLDQLVSNNAFFDRAVFQCHGGPGRAWFGNTALTATGLQTDFTGRNYHLLFPWSWSRIYFDGCNVAEGADGTAFLHAVGSVFLRTAGGTAFGWEDIGRGIPGWVPIFGGHTIHFFGKLKTVGFGPGGVVIPPKPIPYFSQQPSGHVREHIGNKI